MYKAVDIFAIQYIHNIQSEGLEGEALYLMYGNKNITNTFIL